MFFGKVGCELGWLNHSVLFIALRYIKGSRKQRFASLVALLATLGIAIGVGALIVVSSIMQGLQERLKANILTDCAHIVVQAQERDIPYLLSLPYVNTLAPHVEGEAMMQYGDDITMVTLQATDHNNLYVSPKYATSFGLSSRQVDSFTLGKGDKGPPVQAVVKMPAVDRTGYQYGSIFPFIPGNYDLALNYATILQYNIALGGSAKVRLISTQNARYTPFGLTPIQRNFKVMAVINSIDKSAAPTVIGNYEDVRRFLRLNSSDMYYRLYLTDPFVVEHVVSFLDGRYNYTDWRARYGDFFRAVGLEKVTMSLMLCLIVLVAAFNILSSLTMVVSSRVSEIAILKTLGLSNLELLAVFLLVGMSASIVGSLVGLALGIPFALNAQDILSFIGVSIVQGELPIELNISNIVIIVVLCQVVSFLCTFYPAYYASKADPVEHLVHS